MHYIGLHIHYFKAIDVIDVEGTQCIKNKCLELLKALFYIAQSSKWLEYALVQ